MDNQDENDRRETLSSMADALKSGVAHQASAIFSDDTKNAASDTIDKAKTVRSDVEDLATSASEAAQKGAADIGRASSKLKSEAIAGAKGAVDERLGRLSDEIARNPLTSVAIAAAIGFLTAVVTRSPYRR